LYIKKITKIGCSTGIVAVLNDTTNNINQPINKKTNLADTDIFIRDEAPAYHKVY